MVVHASCRCMTAVKVWRHRLWRPRVASQADRSSEMRLKLEPVTWHHLAPCRYVQLPSFPWSISRYQHDSRCSYSCGTLGSELSAMNAHRHLEVSSTLRQLAQHGWEGVYG